MKYKYWYWKNFFKKDEIIKINNIINKNKFKGKDLKADSKKTSYVTHIKYKYIKKYIYNLINLTNIVNKNNFGYNIYEISDETILNYNSYISNNKSEYQWHIDETCNNFEDIKLTLLINLSNEKYQGGKFSLFTSEKHTQINEFSEPGDVLMFKSYFLHKISPVTKGERISLAHFIKGPKFI